MQDPTTRDPQEIQHVCDLLAQLKSGAFTEISVRRQLAAALAVAEDVLCWVLCHDHPNDFAELLGSLREAVRKAGYRSHHAAGVEEGAAVALLRDRLGRLPGDLAALVVKGELTAAEAEGRVRERAREALAGLERPSSVCCKTCGKVHSPVLPHDPTSPLYRHGFAAEHGHYPDWADAMAHCPEPLQGRLVSALNAGDSWPLVKNPLPAAVLANLRKIFEGVT